MYPISPPNSPPTSPKSPPLKKIKELKATDSPLSGFGTLKRFLFKPCKLGAMIRKEISWQNKLSFTQLMFSKTQFPSPLDRFYGDLLARIEQFVNQHIEDDQEVDKILKRIKTILEDSSLSPFSRFSHISLLYYYLERDQLLPDAKTSLVQHRFEEIKEEVELLLNDAFPSIHSCVQTYLLRTFCNMSLFADGKINHGGAATVLVLLNGELSAHFKDDHLQHIRSIFKKLMEDPLFQSAIEESLDRINPLVEKFIRIDCKIPIDATITPQHVRQFCLLGLLHDLRQFFLPNCYSVATLSYGIRTDPVRILSIYKQLIAEGAIEVSAGIKIPIARIAIDRLMFDPDLDSIVDVALFLRSTLFQTITRVAKMQVSTPIEEGFLVLREVLKRVSLSSASPQTTFIAAVLTMGSYKRNILQEMVLAQMEFLETNRTQLLTRRDHSPRAVKGQFIEFLHRSIFGQIQKTFPDYLAQESVAEFFLQLKEEMERRFWLQDCSKPVKVVASELIVNNLDGTAVRVTCNNDNIQTVKDFFSQHRRLLYIKEGGSFMSIIWTICAKSSRKLSRMF